MNANLFTTKDYENKTAFRLQKNKPNQTQPVVSLSNLFQMPTQRLPGSKHKCSPGSSPVAWRPAIGAIPLWPNQFYAQAKNMPFFYNVTALITNAYIHLRYFLLLFMPISVIIVA
jgi:hypothetical protein